jgi:A/G-specific adenine glycosylase
MTAQSKRKISTPAPVPSMLSPDHRAMTEKVLNWYEHHRRDLPWRMPPGQLADPYQVMLSEIMLQQTTVEAVKPYFHRFLARWPRLSDLAAASQDDVMKLWAGLGYYSRARNLHKAAQAIMTDYNGQFPDNEAELLNLPGIGSYTAAAIAAIAFGRRAVVIDANIERIMARYAAIAAPLPAAKPAIRAALDIMTPSDRSGDFAQALMDIGSRICTPPRKKAGEYSQPQCLICPLASGCQGRHANPASWPRKPAKPDRAKRQGEVLILISDDQHIALIKRPDKGLLGGMMLFPTTGWPDGSRRQIDYPVEPDSLIARCQAVYEHAATPQRMNAAVEHVFSHFELTLNVTVLTGLRRQDVARQDVAIYEQLIWCPLADLGAEALPSVMRKVVLLLEANDLLQPE